MFLYSCEDNFNLEYKTDTKLYSDDAEILKVGATSSEDYIKIEDYPTWSAITNQDWITIIETNGSSTDFLYYKVENNTEKSNREGKILIFNEGKHIKTYTIKQDCSYIKSSQEKLEISNKANNFIVSIQSNGYWIISAEDSWITTEIQEGMYSHDVIISIADNKSGQERTGILKFIDQANNEAILTIKQQGLGIYIDVSDIVVGCIENEIEIKYNSDGEVIFESDSWISCECSDETLSISIIEDNISSSERMGTILMYLDGITDFSPIKINVTQKGIMLNQYVDLGITVKEKLITYESKTSHLSLCNNKSNNYMEFPADGFARNYLDQFPSKEEFEELIKLKNKIATINNTTGYVFVGDNGNSLFIPYGSYWDASVQDIPGYYFTFSKSGIERNSDNGLIKNAKGLFVKRTNIE